MKIHKRERSSPTAATSSSSSQTSIKRYKLVSNDVIKLEPVSQESIPKSQSQSQPSTSLKGQQKEAPKSRADFLREVCIRNEIRVETYFCRFFIYFLLHLQQVRSVVDSEQFRDFGEAMKAYMTGGRDAFEKLMMLLLNVLGTPQLRYMLNGMRRYLKAEDKSKFDMRLASLD